MIVVCYTYRWETPTPPNSNIVTWVSLHILDNTHYIAGLPNTSKRSRSNWYDLDI